MTTPLDPYASATSNLPSAVQSIIPGVAIGANSQTINTAEMNLSSSQGGAILGYSGTPSAGNLVFSLASASGTDNFGNSVPTGLVVGSGSIVGVSLTGIQMDATSTLQGTQINQPQVLNPSVAGGTAASLVHTMTNANGSVLGYSSSTASTTFATNGNYLWTVPTAITAATNIRVQCWGAGSGGGGGNPSDGGESGGGGEYAEEPNFTVLPGQVYSVIVGQGGSGGATDNAGNSGGATTFQSQSGGGNTVTANGGNAGFGGVLGAGGSGSQNSIHFNGGNGANSSGDLGGAGGGGSGSYTGNGNQGTASNSNTGGVGGGAIGGGGGGGAGGNSAANGANGTGPGGAGGGAGANSVTSSNKTYPCADPGGTYAYRGSDATSSPNALINHDGPMFQGFPSAAYGTQYSYWILPWAQIQSDMSGLNITSVSIKLKCLYSYYSGGVYAHMYYTSLDSFGNTGNRTGGSPTFVSNFLIKENQTLTQGLGLNGGIGAALQSGAAKSIQFSSIPLTPAGDYYGSFDSGANNGQIPALIVYYNNGGGSTAGTGADGQVIISYQSSSAPTFQLAVSSTTTADVFGNPYNPGFTSSQLTILGSQAPSTTPTQINNTNATSVTVGANTSGTIIATNASGFTGQMPTNQADLTLNSQTGTVPSALTKAYNIPAGDPQVGTVYRMTAWGDLHTPASGNGQIRWQMNVGGSSAASIQIGGASLVSATFYEWMLTSIVQWSAIGSGGNAYVWGMVQGAQFNVLLQGGSSNTTVQGVDATSVFPLTTLSANTFQLLGSWSNVVTAQTVRCFGSMLERLGP